MDIVSHFVAGFSSGLYFGKPLTGAAIAVLPDLVIMGERKLKPTRFYIVTHSFLFLLICTLFAELAFDLGVLTFVSIVSHLLLDLTTHGKVWSSRLFWPNPFYFKYGVEWEFFNKSWFFGLVITLIWSLLWLALYMSGTGFQF